MFNYLLKKFKGNKFKKIEFMRLQPGACIPEFNGVGFTLFALNETLILPHEIKKLKTGISFNIPKEIYGKIYTIKSFGMKSVSCWEQVFISNFGGEIEVWAHNFGNDTFLVQKGDEIANIVFNRICNVFLWEVYSLQDKIKKGGNYEDIPYHII